MLFNVLKTHISKYRNMYIYYNIIAYLKLQLVILTSTRFFFFYFTNKKNVSPRNVKLKSQKRITLFTEFKSERVTRIFLLIITSCTLYIKNICITVKSFQQVYGRLLRTNKNLIYYYYFYVNTFRFYYSLRILLRRYLIFYKCLNLILTNNFPIVFNCTPLSSEFVYGEISILIISWVIVRIYLSL